MAEDKEEQLLNEDQWRAEALGVIQDVQEHVQNIGISSKIRSTNQHIYLNVTTAEGVPYCVELSALGFRITGNAYDDKANPSDTYFETPYSLLDYFSPSYRISFGTSLLKKLENISSQESDSDKSI